MESNMLQSLNEEIRPSADLRNHYPEISRECRENRTAVIITVNGRGDTVSLGYQQYREMKSRLELLELLGEAEQDVRSGNIAPMEDTINELRRKLISGDLA